MADEDLIEQMRVEANSRSPLLFRRTKSLQLKKLNIRQSLNQIESKSCTNSPIKSILISKTIKRPVKLSKMSHDTVIREKCSMYDPSDTRPTKDENVIASRDDEDESVRRVESVSQLNRYTRDVYDDPSYRWFREGRMRCRRRSSTSDVYSAEEAGKEVRVVCRCDGGSRYLKRLTRGGLACERRLIWLHLIINDKLETILFCRDLLHDQLREGILGTAGANPCDVVYLRNKSNEIVALSPNLDANTPATAYTVHIQPCPGGGEGASGHRCARRCQRPHPQLQANEHIICTGGKFLNSRRHSEPHQHLVWQRFYSFKGVEVTEDEMNTMLTSDVDSYCMTDEKILTVLFTMFERFDLIKKFSIPAPVLKNFLYEVYKCYNEVPFHNFRHCFCVTQMFYAICMKAQLRELIGELNVLILLVSCICHDLDHPGFNNIYQINARTELALRYNDISPLENHHCSVAFHILQFHECNIFRNCSASDFRVIREGIIRCILATDMSRHNEILSQFVEIGSFDPSNTAHVNLLSMVLIKVADISNEVRPLPVAEPWLDRLLEEFFAQSDLEKCLGLPVTPFMDRDKVTKPSSQCAFIGLVVLPLFEGLVHQFPSLDDLLLQPAKAALAHYARLAEQASKQRSMSIAVDSDSSAHGPMLENRNNSVTNSEKSKSGALASAKEEDTSIDSPKSEQPPASPVSELCAETEVEVSEKAFKFKITTEGSFDRRSYPSSRKGSREAGLSSAELIRALHFTSTPSPPLVEVENKDDDSSNTITTQPKLSGLALEPLSPSSAAKNCKCECSTSKPLSPANSCGSPSGSTLQKSIISKLRCLTDKMTFRVSPPDTPSRANQRRSSKRDI